MLCHQARLLLPMGKETILKLQEDKNISRSQQLQTFKLKKKLLLLSARTALQEHKSNTQIN
jgi:hypothetical protein